MNPTCIQSLDDYTKLTNYVEEVRMNISFQHFLHQSIYGSSDTSKTPIYISSTIWIRIPLYVIIIIISMFGNLIVILVISFNRFMRKSTNFFILNLAVCDLAILVSCMWVQIVASINKNWVLGHLFCKVNSYMQMVSVLASVLTLSVVTCDRFMGIMYPLKARLTNRKSAYCIAVIWLLSIIIAAPNFIYRTYSERRWSDYVERHCDDSGWPISFSMRDDKCGFITRPLKRIYYTLVILLLFFLPILIMSITYSIIIRKLWNAEAIGESYSHSRQLILKKKKKVKPAR